MPSKAILGQWRSTRVPVPVRAGCRRGYALRCRPVRLRLVLRGLRLRVPGRLLLVGANLTIYNNVLRVVHLCHGYILEIFVTLERASSLRLSEASQRKLGSRSISWTVRLKQLLLVQIQILTGVHADLRSRHQDRRSTIGLRVPHLVMVAAHLGKGRLWLTNSLLTTRESPRLVTAASAEVFTSLARSNGKVRRRHLVSRRVGIAPLSATIAANSGARVRMRQRLRSVLVEDGYGRHAAEVHISGSRLEIEMLCFVRFKHIQI